MKYCAKCLMPESRPRITFDAAGKCNACQHAEAKRTTIDWNARWSSLEALCHKFRGRGYWDVLVPCSGGKDGSYVAWRLKHDLRMNPLCVTLMPQLPTEVGKQNLENFKKSGFDHITISPNPETYRRLAIRGLKEQGRPKMPFVIGISTVTLQVAKNFNIPFVVYGEEGEKEYGGASIKADKISRDYLMNYYYSGKYPEEMKDLHWWTLPDLEGLHPVHWSYFENWDPQLHAELAKEKCGLQTIDKSIGTFTNNAQLDDILQDLHAYFMFLKFGFGRTTSDASIEIRAGRMERAVGLKLLKKYDGAFPSKYLKDYLKYFKLTEEEFQGIIDKFANKDILKKVNNRWTLKNEAH